MLEPHRKAHSTGDSLICSSMFWRAVLYLGAGWGVIYHLSLTAVCFNFDSSLANSHSSHRHRKGVPWALRVGSHSAHVFWGNHHHSICTEWLLGLWLPHYTVSFWGLDNACSAHCHLPRACHGRWHMAGSICEGTVETPLHWSIFWITPTFFHFRGTDARR